ncbi:MAG: hypothetical protein KA801_08060 [Syntrophorhabdaceae bacterium]|nr:hypothetical protein [Syntrophorhabdaceae bacterium]
MDPALSQAEQLIDYVPEHRRVVETLGWQPGIWGGFFLVVGILILSESRLPLSTITLELLGVVFFVGVVLACWQMAMHRNRTVLVRDSGLIRVFRKRRLDMVVDPEEIGLEKADFVLMLKIGVPLLMCAAGFIAVGGTLLWEDKKANADNLCILALGLASGASLASASWTRFFRRHLRVPVKNSRWFAEETVLVSPSQYRHLFPLPEDSEPF